MNTLLTYRQRFNDYSQQYLPKDIEHQGDIYDAVNYSMNIGGKRLRPALVYATADSFNIPLEMVDNVALALECIHTYSLIHDDLPAMDDDALRRGQSACHIKFGEATAILAGDALNTFAFEILTHHNSNPIIQLKQVNILAKCAGISGMIGGQDIDLFAEGKNISLEQLQILHSKKTAQIIQACLLMPYQAVKQYNKGTEQLLIKLGKTIGLFYQIQDDILDVTQSSEALGKPSQSDIENNKSTYVSLLGLKEAKVQALKLSNEIESFVQSLNLQDSSLNEIIQIIIRRSH